MAYGAEVDLALIDADILVYRSGFAAEHTIYTLTCEELPDGLDFDYKKDLNEWVKTMKPEEFSVESRVEIEPLSNALHTVKRTISTIIEATKPADIKLFLSKGANFRDKVATIHKYKGNRDNQRRPQHYKDIRKYLIKYYDAIECQGVEADDDLADGQTDRTVICSIDKDLLQVPGRHYNWVREEKTYVTPETALRTLWEQVLTGDKTDNIPGIFRCGPKTAKGYLAQCDTEEEMREVCIEKWDEYLHGDKHPTWVEYDEDAAIPTHSYKHWDTGEELEVNAANIVEEVYQLVKVGRR